MPVTALPDLAGAINARLRSSSAIAALAGTRISTARQTSWSLPNYAVLIEAGKGEGPGPEQPGLVNERVEVRCYGPNVYQAHLLWRTLDYFFCPPVGAGSSRPSSFRVTASGEMVNVTKVEREGGPLRLTEPDETWPYTWAAYIVTYSEPS